jgi:hypothetical protein
VRSRKARVYPSHVAVEGAREPRDLGWVEQIHACAVVSLRVVQKCQELEVVRPEFSVSRGN